MDELVKITLPLEQYILDNGMERLIEVVVKNRGVWEVHLSDADPWPSEPHAHNLEAKEKLDLITGNVYDPTTRKFLYKMSDKTMRYFFKNLTKNDKSPIAQKLIAQKNLISYL